MKALVVSDSYYKIGEIISTLYINEVHDITTVKNVVDAEKSIDNDTYDFICLDLDVSLSLSNPNIYNDKIGLRLVESLIAKEVHIPTIIYSAMQATDEELNTLLYSGYPIINQTNNKEELRGLISSLITQINSGKAYLVRK